MCKIRIIINAVDNMGGGLTAEGRYRFSGSTKNYKVYSIPDINNAYTPDLVRKGEYELQIRVIDSDGGFSPWVSLDNFKVGDCNPLVTTSASVSNTFYANTNDACAATPTYPTVVYYRANNDDEPPAANTQLFSDASLTTTSTLTGIYKIEKVVSGSPNEYVSTELTNGYTDSVVVICV